MVIAAARLFHSHLVGEKVDDDVNIMNGGGGGGGSINSSSGISSFAACWFDESNVKVKTHVV
jgi:hypothetical protein